MVAGTRRRRHGSPLSAAAVLLLLAALSRCAAASPPAASPPAAAGDYRVNASALAQTILGVGFEIQSDSIGSGNHGLPDANTSVPGDLVPSEKARFFADMLAGFRFCRLALGLYFRGLTPDNRSIVERWPGQAAGLAEMAAAAGLEGFAVEYWSPAPGWKNTSAYIDGSLVGFDAPTLAAFGDAVAGDFRYLAAHGIAPVWGGLQNEPAVGPAHCIYSCCGYDAAQYHAAFAAVAPKLRAAFPELVIHASSWSGVHWSPQLAADPAALALVDVWTFHDVGGDSNDQIARRDYYLAGSAGKPVMNNEYEYLDAHTSPMRTITAAQSIMNWMVFENAPSWFWLHALKPDVNSEAAGYGLGVWQPLVNSSNTSRLPPGHWGYIPYNWNSLAGFTRYLPWDSVRVEVAEATVQGDQRIMAYLFDPAMARWRAPGGRQPPLARGRGARATLLDATASRAAASQLGLVLTNRGSANYTFHLWLHGLGGVPARRAAGVGGARAAAAAASAAMWASTSPHPATASGAMPRFTGHLYGPNTTDGALGSATAVPDPASGVPTLVITLQPLEIQFWVEE